jgi:choline transporter-like protein 2/4/5
MAERGCTDILFLFLFIIYWIGMFIVMGVALGTGDPKALSYGSDYLGNRCGQGDYESRPNVFYPRIGADVASQLAVVTTTPWRLQLYGLCVDTCPQPGDEPVHDYGCATASCHAVSTDQTWEATINTMTVMNRCLPVKNENVTVVTTCSMPTCSEMTSTSVECFSDLFPEKDLWLLTDQMEGSCKQQFDITLETTLKSPGADPVVEQIASSISGINAAISGLESCKEEILIFGLVCGVVLGILWIVFLRFFAKAAVYLMLTLVCLMLIIVTCGIAYKAGMAPDFVYDAAEDYVADAMAEAHAEAATSGIPVAGNTAEDMQNMLGAASENVVLWQIGFYVFGILTVVVILMLLSLRKEVATCVALVQEASSVIGDIPFLIFFPITTIIAQFLLFVLVIGIFAYIFTSTADAFQDFVDDSMDMLNDTSADMAEDYSDTIEDHTEDFETVNSIMGVFWLFGFLWTNNLLLATSTTIIASVVAYWFFYMKGDDEDKKYPMPILSSVKCVATKHMGTMAFGSLIVAIIQAMRIVLAYIDEQTKDLQEGNLAIKFAMKCVGCCLWCFEKSAKFVTRYCYLYVAVNGDNFCTSCKQTFKLFVNHPGQVVMNAMVNKVLYLTQSLGIPLVCALLCYNTISVNPEKTGIQTATFATAFLAYMVVRSFGSVYETCVDTLCVSCFRDKELYASKYIKPHSSLASALGMAKDEDVDQQKE